MFKKLFVLLIFSTCLVSAEPFTVCSYNCGGLSNHYDYLRSSTMQKLMQQRYDQEPEQMAQVERIQAIAAKMLFSKNESQEAQQIWVREGLQEQFEKLVETPINASSCNYRWNRLSEEMISHYHTRPVVLSDEEVRGLLADHITSLDPVELTLERTRAQMAKRIFHHFLKYDLICLQEANYLNREMFSSQYELLMSENHKSPNAIAWKKERFELIEIINLHGRSIIALFKDKLDQALVLVASAHLTGCNPFYAQFNDSSKGDQELLEIISKLGNRQADVKVIAMDANVAATHPRMGLIKEHDFSIDGDHFIEMSCTNPYQILNTRIDWIAAWPAKQVEVINIPVTSVGLNNLHTNMSDHKPIASRINITPRSNQDWFWDNEEQKNDRD